MQVIPYRTTTMYLFTDINALFYIFSLTLESFVTITPLHSKTIDTANSGLPNSGVLTIISTSVIKEL